MQGGPGIDGQPGTVGDRGQAGNPGSDGGPGKDGTTGQDGLPGVSGNSGAPVSQLAVVRYYAHICLLYILKLMGCSMQLVSNDKHFVDFII